MIKVIQLDINQDFPKGADWINDNVNLIKSFDKHVVKFEAEVDTKFIRRFMALLNSESGVNKREKKKKEETI
jgi:hypothetical protein